MWTETPVVLLTLVFWLPTVCPQSPEDIQRETRQCQHQHGITDEEFGNIMQQRNLPKEEPIESRRCFAECVMAAEKLTKDGKLDEDAVLQVMEEGFKDAGVEMDEETIREVISDCSINRDTGKCTNVYNSWNCVTAHLLDYGGESDKRDEAVENKCKATFNVDESVFVEGKSGYDEDVIILKDEKNENHRCFVKCLMEGFGYIKDGELDQEMVMQEVLKDLAEKSANPETQKVKEAIKACAQKTSDEKCDKVYQIAKCITNVSG